MGEIIITDKSQADKLASCGFYYKEQVISGRQAYVFIQTKELMKELSQNYDKGSFLVLSTVNF